MKLADKDINNNSSEWVKEPVGPGPNLWINIWHMWGIYIRNFIYCFNYEEVVGDIANPTNGDGT